MMGVKLLDKKRTVERKNQRAYLAIRVSDIKLKGLMILENFLLCFKPSYRSVQISPRFL